MGGFFWKNTDLETEYTFLRDFMRRAILKKGIILVKNFSLSMGPHYIVGGGRFGYIINHWEENVIWFILNLWNRSFLSFTGARQQWDASFWYGWYRSDVPNYGCEYYGITNRECDDVMLKMISKATDKYYES